MKGLEKVFFSELNSFKLDIKIRRKSAIYTDYTTF